MKKFEIKIFGHFEYWKAYSHLNIERLLEGFSRPQSEFLWIAEMKDGDEFIPIDAAYIIRRVE